MYIQAVREQCQGPFRYELLDDEEKEKLSRLEAEALAEADQQAGCGPAEYAVRRSTRQREGCQSDPGRWSRRELEPRYLRGSRAGD